MTLIHVKEATAATFRKETKQPVGSNNVTGRAVLFEGENKETKIIAF